MIQVSHPKPTMFFCPREPDGRTSPTCRFVVGLKSVGSVSVGAQTLKVRSSEPWPVNQPPIPWRQRMGQQKSSKGKPPLDVWNNQYQNNSEQNVNSIGSTLVLKLYLNSCVTQELNYLEFLRSRHVTKWEPFESKDRDQTWRRSWSLIYVPLEDTNTKKVPDTVSYTSKTEAVLFCPTWWKNIFRETFRNKDLYIGMQMHHAYCF